VTQETLNDLSTHREELQQKYEVEKMGLFGFYTRNFSGEGGV